MKICVFESIFTVNMMPCFRQKKIIPLARWASQKGVKPNVAANKAKRQTIPAFRLREKWMIPEEFSPSK
ncbi:MAG: hypothetical protein NT109_05550 [Flavobacteriia bacterium]|nr:hypothetical protein [Flavobacteriia bacterium]